MSIDVDQNVPLPDRGRRGTAYPWAKLAIGDSFTVPAIQRHAMASAAARYAKRHGVGFTSRLEGKGDAARVRVWRTA